MTNARPTIHSDDWASRIAADITTAQTRVIMTALSMLPPRVTSSDALSALWLALIRAAERKIAVTIIMPMPSEAHPATARNHTTAMALRAAGIITSLVPAQRLLHAKTATIDAAIAWVGSGNLTAAAAHHNREIYMRTDDPRSVAEVYGFQLRQLADGVTTW
jgi:phosphatidylserine/phosphatidylglycerophosphate/cardiolipin synthase-like enzyme